MQGSGSSMARFGKLARRAFSWFGGQPDSGATGPGDYMPEGSRRDGSTLTNPDGHPGVDLCEYDEGDWPVPGGVVPDWRELPDGPLLRIFEILGQKPHGLTWVCRGGRVCTVWRRTAQEILLGDTAASRPKNLKKPGVKGTLSTKATINENRGDADFGEACSSLRPRHNEAGGGQRPGDVAGNGAAAQVLGPVPEDEVASDETFAPGPREPSTSGEVDMRMPVRGRHEHGPRDDPRDEEVHQPARRRNRHAMSPARARQARRAAQGEGRRRMSSEDARARGRGEGVGTAGGHEVSDTHADLQMDEDQPTRSGSVSKMGLGAASVPERGWGWGSMFGRRHSQDT